MNTHRPVSPVEVVSLAGPGWIGRDRAAGAVEGSETYAAFQSVVSTAKANHASVYDTIRFVLSAKLSMEAVAGMG